MRVARDVSTFVSDARERDESPGARRPRNSRISDIVTARNNSGEYQCLGVFDSARE